MSVVAGPEVELTSTFFHTSVFPAVQVGVAPVGYSAPEQVLLPALGLVQQIPVVELVTDPVE